MATNYCSLNQELLAISNQLNIEIRLLVSFGKIIYAIAVLNASFGSPKTAIEIK